MNKEPQKVGVQVASSHLKETSSAIEALLEDLDAASAKLTLVFYGASHDDEAIATALDRATGARGVAGTTAGELTSEGFAHDSMTGISIHGPEVRSAVEVIPQLDNLSLVPIVHLPDKLARGIDRRRDELDPDRHLWLFLVDGISGKEGLLTPFFMQAAPNVGLVGGSLGDDTSFRKVRLIHHGRIYRDAAASILVEYPRPFTVFKHTHMKLTDQRLEATKVAKGGRLLEELDGEIAQIAYARALDIDPSEVTTDLVSQHPLGYRFRGQPFPVAIMQITKDGAFRLGSSIQHGEELSILESDELVDHTRRSLAQDLDRIDADHAQGMLLFHCVARHTEAAAHNQVDQLADALCQAPVCGLNTYGEQFKTLHVNHCLTGVVFG
ncbi:MAG: FIST signal transduction protein [Persicimonas sp.]